METPTVVYTTSRLDSGLTVIVARRPWSKTFFASLAFRPPDAPDERASTQLAHMIEHLAIESMGEETLNSIMSAGVEVNGQADRGSITFWSRGHTTGCDQGLAFLRRMLDPIAIDGDLIRRERRIIEHEVALHHPYALELEWERAHAAISGRVEPVSAPKREWSRVRRMSVDELSRWSSRLLDPRRALLVVVGPMDADAVMHRFGDIGVRTEPAQGTSPPEIAASQSLTPRIRVKGSLGSRWTRVHVLLPAQSDDLETMASLDILADLSGGGYGSSLYKSLRQKDQIAYDMGAMLTRPCGRLVLELWATVRPRDFGVATARMKAVLHQHLTDAFDDERLHAAVVRACRVLDHLEDDGSSLCGALAYHWTYSRGAPWTPAEQRTRLVQLQSDRFNTIVQQTVAPDNRYILCGGEVGMFTKWRLRKLLRA